MGAFWWAVIIVVFSLLVIGNLSSKSDKQGTRKSPTPKPQAQTNYPNFTVRVTSGDADGAFFCKIAGVQHRCDENDIGGFVGYVKPEPENEYDKNAQAVYRNDGKKVGYIPRDEQPGYLAFSEGKRCVCVGFIKKGDEVPLFGKVKVFDAPDEQATLGGIKFVLWMIKNLGLKYIPADFNVKSEKPLKTKAQWIAFLEDYIEKAEGDMYEEVTDDE